MHTKHYTLSFLILLVYGCLQIWIGNIIPFCNGYGQDGCLYGAITENFYQKVITEGLNAYHVQRLLPLFIVHYLLKFLQIPLEAFYIIKSFQIFNLLILLGIQTIWWKICKLQTLNHTLFWVGLILALLNFQIGYNAFYYPIATDYLTYLLGFLLLYFYLRNWLWGMSVVSFLGAFCWPSFLYFSFFLMLFPYPTHQLSTFYEKYKTTFNNWIVAAVITIVYFVFVASHIQGNGIYWSVGLYEDKIEGNFYSFYVALVINVALLFAFLRFYVPAFRLMGLLIAEHFLKIVWLRVLAFIVLYLIVNGLVAQLSLPEPNYIDPLQLPKTIAFYSVLSPLFYLVEATTSMGLIFLFIILYFKHFFQRSVLHFGTSIYITFFVFVILRFVPEVRSTINFHPFIVFLVCYSLQDFFISKRFLITLGLLSFFLSRVYLSFLPIPPSWHDTSFGLMEGIFIHTLGWTRDFYLWAKLITFVLLGTLLVLSKKKIKENFYIQSYLK
ncbi:MAG: hypothetical protein EAZ55_07720 [Cytophagales bacterium]|nr:MAG: hypothetical protein EAZ55_07720 [Cytophagales bacterium]